jgi:hypothetical protein
VRSFPRERAWQILIDGIHIRSNYHQTSPVRRVGLG